MAPMVTLERRGRVAVFTLDRPEARNAVNEELSTQMEQLLEEFEADTELSVAILRSSFDGVFCAGADLKAVGRGERLTSRKGGFCGLSFPRRKLLIGAIDGGEPPNPSGPSPPPLHPPPQAPQAESSLRRRPGRRLRARARLRHARRLAPRALRRPRGHTQPRADRRRRRPPTSRPPVRLLPHARGGPSHASRRRIHRLV